MPQLINRRSQDIEDNSQPWFDGGLHQPNNHRRSACPIDSKERLRPSLAPPVDSAQQQQHDLYERAVESFLGIFKPMLVKRWQHNWATPHDFVFVTSPKKIKWLTSLIRLSKPLAKSISCITTPVSSARQVPFIPRLRRNGSSPSIFC